MQNTELTMYIQTELQKGATPETIRAVLLQAGWTPEQIDEAFGVERPDEIASLIRSLVDKPPVITKIVRVTIFLFVLSSAGSLLQIEFLVYAWFLAACMVLISLIAFVVVSIRQRRGKLLIAAILWLLILCLIGLGTCAFNMKDASFAG